MPLRPRCSLLESVVMIECCLDVVHRLLAYPTHSLRAAFLSATALHQLGSMGARDFHFVMYEVIKL